jgi:hypothetical protein
MVERGGFEPPKAFADRFTVCSLWPLGNLSMNWFWTIKGVLGRNKIIYLVELAMGLEPATC